MAHIRYSIILELHFIATRFELFIQHCAMFKFKFKFIKGAGRNVKFVSSQQIRIHNVRLPDSVVGTEQECFLLA